MWWQRQGNVTFVALKDQKQDVNTETELSLSQYRKYDLHLPWSWIKRHAVGCLTEVVVATGSGNKPMSSCEMDNFNYKCTFCGFMEL